MQTLKVSVSLPGAAHPDMELRLSADDSACDVVIALPVQSGQPAQAVRLPRDNVVPLPRDSESPRDDDYVLGGYAGI
ncbi:hypothetical protein ASG87_09325 [Frateuria sp. Soil773]|uniref:hypothetical protein n=1 Tax=Frateuria sp. Soil773 TaxID=1736407 RepID=UPI0006F5AC1E|nr:hypothetical protein [Frateuria sp. Soil773]KRE88759.1 hypothetical protein ASG87_09325 [Frateuria sp. Soil773]